MRRERRLAAALVAACMLGAPVAAPAAPDWASLAVQPYEPPQPAPAFSLPDLDGNSARLADYRGRVVLLAFWTTW
jgi:hypothetical protein